MSSIASLIDSTRLLLDRPDWTHARLARLAGIHCYDVIGVKRNDWDPPASVLHALEPVLSKYAEPLPTKPRRGRPRDLAAGDTFEQLARLYIDKWSRFEHVTVNEQERWLFTHIVPRIGERTLASITERDMSALLDDLTDTFSPSTARLYLRCTRAVFRFGVRRGVITNNPCRDLTVPVPRAIRRKVLLPRELALIWEALNNPTHSSLGSNVLLWQLATAQRITPCRTMDVADIDRDWSSWSVPAKGNKSRHPNIVPLSTLAQALLSGFVHGNKRRGPAFPSARLGKKICVTGSCVAGAIAVVRRSTGIAFNSHDFRRTAATNMVRLGHSRTVVGKVLGHRDPLAIASYDQHTYENEKRTALQDWANYLVELTGGDASP